MAKPEPSVTESRDEPISISVGARNVLEELISTIEETVRNARSMPLSSSVMVPRDALLEAISSLKRSLPEEISRARTLLHNAEEVLARARTEADRIVEAAKGDRARAISKTEVAQAAAREAEKLVASAETQARRMRADAEGYVEGKLANFEVALQKTLKAVERDRARLAGKLADAEDITADEED